MRERAVATIGLIALVTVGCAQNGDTGKVIDRHQAERTACDGADSLVFGHVITDPETKDLSGREIVLRRGVGRGLDRREWLRVSSGPLCRWPS